jgi:hypothetical protein
MSEFHPLKHCENCAFSLVPRDTTVCLTCMYNPAGVAVGSGADHWRPLVVSHAPVPPRVDSAKAKDAQIGGDHYVTLSVQPWAAMESWMTVEEFRGFLLGCAIKRLARTKGERLEDLKKARHELDRLIETYHE